MDKLTQDTIETIEVLAKDGVKLEHWWFHYGNRIADAARQYFDMLDNGGDDDGDD